MKTKISIVLFLLISSFGFAQKNGLEINGWTNVNTFKCSNTKFQNSLSIYSFKGNQLPKVIFKLDDFDCRNKMMTSDFRKILQSDQYPNLTIRFVEFTKTSADRFIAVLEVKMMTVSKNYQVEFSMYKNNLVGTKRVRFSDFKIVPPKKMGGMVYVKDELDLFFSLSVKD